MKAQFSKKTGFLIAVEGGDGCGTTTHSLLLTDGIREWLPHFGSELLDSMGLNGQVVNLAGPSDSDFGKSLKEKFENGILNDPIASTMAFALDRWEQYVNTVKPLLENGAIVVMDRYVHSSIVHQGLQGAPEEFIVQCNKNVPKPDLVFHLTAETKIIFNRIRFRKFDPLNLDPDIEQKISKQHQSWHSVWDVAARLNYPDSKFKPFIIDTGVNNETETSKKIISEATAQILEKCLVRCLVKFD
jgi:dTMP kinase